MRLEQELQTKQPNSRLTSAGRLLVRGSRWGRKAELPG